MTERDWRICREDFNISIKGMLNFNSGLTCIDRRTRSASIEKLGRSEFAIFHDECN